MMAEEREYPNRPIIGVGGVVVQNNQVLLARRGTEPLKGQWSIPGGMLEVGESLKHGVKRELEEETGLEVAVLDLIEVCQRIIPAPAGAPQQGPHYHYVILDYLCTSVGGKLHPGGDITELALIREEDFSNYHLTEATLQVLHKALCMIKGHNTDRDSE
jgi:8-oxo-dGTP diphosphatase